MRSSSNNRNSRTACASSNAASGKSNEATIPPLMEIMEREKARQHENQVTRGEVANVRRDQNQGLLLLFLLLAATTALVWWGLQLMRGT